MKAVSSSRLIRYAILASVVGSICPDYAFASCDGLDSFAGHKDTYALLANQMKNNGWSGNDDRAVRVQYSFKYSILGCPATNFESALKAEDIEVFSSYTGVFDFYARSRESDPVINRTSNLGILHVRFPGRLLHLDDTSMEVSLEHRSTGQVFEPTTASGTATAQRNYDRADSDARQFFDTLSRGSNYVGVQASWKTDVANQPVHFRLQYHAYINQHSEVTWGPFKDSGRTIKDYDLVTVQASIPTEKYGEWGAAWKVGTSGLKTDSFDINWQAPACWNLPLYLNIHSGGMNTLSNFTQRQDSIGLGLIFFNSLTRSTTKICK